MNSKQKRAAVLKAAGGHAKLGQFFEEAFRASHSGNYKPKKVSRQLATYRDGTSDPPVYVFKYAMKVNTPVRRRKDQPQEFAGATA